MSTQEEGKMRDTGTKYPFPELYGDMYGLNAWYTYVDYHHEGYLDKVGSNLLKSLMYYIDYGREPGGFLTALISNNLMLTMSKADDYNLDAKKIYNILRWLYNVPPSGAWGSKAAVDRWIKKGGMHGQWQEKNNV